MLQDLFLSLAGRYCADAALCCMHFTALQSAYCGKGRHYHTLVHLEALVAELTPFSHLISDWDTLLFTLFYHDAVYNALKSDNEEQSAALARRCMTELGTTEAIIARCEAQILATKSHAIANDNDTNLFTDADLAILGQPWDAYCRYAEQVRREYSMYPDLLYRPGRKKVLAHFLSMPRIYKTPQFADRYEAAARANMARELAAL